MRKYTNESTQLEFEPIPAFQFHTELRELLETGRLSPEKCKLMLRQLMEIRAFEDKIAALKMGQDPRRPDFEFVGATHLYAGQEAVAVGAMAALRDGDYITSTHRGHGHCLAKQGDLKRMFAELLGKEAGYCRGRGGSMHIADMEVNHLGANAIVGGSYGIATGAGVSSKHLKDGRVTVCFAGDGAMNNGIAHEAMNMAAYMELPVVYVTENNGVGMTVPTCEATNLDYLARRAAAYGMHGEVVDGMDALAVWDAVGRATEVAREKGLPSLLDCVTFRIRGHSLSDDRRSYRTRDEEEVWLEQDCIKRLSTQLVVAGVLKEDDVQAMRQKSLDDVEEALEFAIQAPLPDANDLMDALFSHDTTETVPAELKTTQFVEPFEKFKRDADGHLLFGEALNEGIREEMLRDRRVVLYGEDVAAYGGAFGATRGLWKIFGDDRVWNTAISEACIVGSGIGAAMTGLRPIVELMYIDFTGLAMDQIGNQAAKIRYMFGGKCEVPLVVRTPIGGGRGYAGQHSQSLESWFMHVPGLKLVVPSTPYDAKGLIKSAVRDNNPVLFVEHQLLYSGKQYKGPVPEEEYTIPIGVADVKREGKDITIVAYSRMMHVALEAAELLAQEGVEAEVIDPRTLIPLDIDTILASVRKTGRVVVVAQCPLTGSSTAEITAQIQEKAFDYLDAPIQRVAAPDCPSPMSPVLEMAYLPNEQDILAAAKEIL